MQKISRSSSSVSRAFNFGSVGRFSIQGIAIAQTLSVYTLHLNQWRIYRGAYPNSFVNISCHFHISFLFSACCEPDCRQIFQLQNDVLTGSKTLQIPPSTQIISYRHIKKHVKGKKKVRQGNSYFLAPFNDAKILHQTVHDAIQGTQAGPNQTVFPYVSHSVDAVNAQPHIALSVKTEHQIYMGEMFIGNNWYTQKGIVSYFRDDGPQGLISTHPAGDLYDANGNNVGDPALLIKQQRLQEKECAEAAAEGRAWKRITCKEALKENNAEDKKARRDFYHKQVQYMQQSAAQQAPGRGTKRPAGPGSGPCPKRTKWTTRK